MGLEIKLAVLRLMHAEGNKYFFTNARLISHMAG
jgi:hypothetical protein